MSLEFTENRLTETSSPNKQRHIYTHRRAHYPLPPFFSVLFFFFKAMLCCVKTSWTS